MPKSKVMIQLHNTSLFLDQNDLTVSESLMKYLKIPANQHVNFRFGSHKQSLKVIPAPGTNELRMSEFLARKLGIHRGTQLRIHYKTSSQTLCIGPLIGVMVSRANPGRPDRPFGAITAFCKELTEACRSQGAFVYFFTPQEIRSTNSSMEGWNYNGGWNKSVFPIADVIHNRLTTRKLENRPSVQYFMKEVKSKYNASVFNEQYLNKTEVFQALNNESGLRHYLPESHHFRNFENLKIMCGKYSVVFLKPVRGSLGKGIIRVSHRGGPNYICHFTGESGVRAQTFSSLAQVFSAVSGKMRKNKYQIQQGVQMIAINRRPVDFRALVQKNLHGQWGITSIVARIAGNHHFVSNLARGGSLSTVKDALIKSNLPTATRPIVQQRLRKASMEISEGIERQIDAHFGELGVDLAVDTNGRVWLLEVNSKPSKNDNTQLSDHKIRPSVKQIIQYSKFLSGFN